MGVDEELIQPANTQIYAFNGAKIKPIGTVALPIYAANWILTVKFFVIDTQSIVKAIMGP